MEGGGNRLLPADAFPLFQEGIGLVLSRWSALQLAVDNEWGGRDSRRKVELLCSDIFTWFTQNKETLYIDDLEMILDETMLSLNTQVDDGSIEEVAEKLIFMHEECVDGNFSSIERLRQSPLLRGAHSHVSQAMSDDEEEEDDDDDGGNGSDGMRNDMMVDAIQQQQQQPRAVNQPRPEASAPAEDGWVQVTSRRSSRGTRN
ncbi:pre-rRNA-processing protein TSR2 homolog [Cucurbita pepo subsp. pepo]|uniref:pre-rRNA-processing protein TSR2 homolog n=1 Tax=Cucurbita pepo subsp. pepo TaxID=3664 RepID=UPI000C9D5901|nr:pre-rRNA-processing protein TSR2 homolog [Cucurbita pepo subsp. pepo]